MVFGKFLDLRKGRTQIHLRFTVSNKDYWDEILFIICGELSKEFPRSRLLILVCEDIEKDKVVFPVSKDCEMC